MDFLRMILLGVGIGFLRDSFGFLQDSLESPQVPLRVDSCWIPSGFLRDSVGILYGFLRDPSRILKGFLKDPLTVP